MIAIVPEFKNSFPAKIAPLLLALPVLFAPAQRSLAGEEAEDSTPSAAATAEVRVFDYLAFAGSERGAINRLTLDVANGKILSQQEVFNDTSAPVFHQLRQTEDGKFLAFTNLHDEAKWVFVLRREGSDLKARRVDLPERGMWIALSRRTLAVAGNTGGVYLIDVESAEVIKSLDLGNSLDPKSHQFGGIIFSPDQRRLAVVCMTDSPQGSRVGGRVAILDAASLEILHDIRLPHLFPELHYGPGSKHNNPVPVGISLGAKSGMAAVILENYGGLLLVEAERLFNGDISTAKFLPVSKDESAGTGFPTRAFFFEFDGREYLLADSASEAGGMTLIDPVIRERLGWIDSGPESIGFFGVLPGDRAYASRAGVLNTRGETETTSKHTERHDLLMFDLKPLREGGLPTVGVVPFPKFLYFAAPAGDAEGRLLLLAFLSKGEERYLKIGLYDTINRKLADLQDSLGVLRGFVPVPRQP